MFYYENPIEILKQFYTQKLLNVSPPFLRTRRMYLEKKNVI